MLDDDAVLCQLCGSNKIYLFDNVLIRVYALYIGGQIKRELLWELSLVTKNIFVFVI